MLVRNGLIKEGINSLLSWVGLNAQDCLWTWLETGLIWTRPEFCSPNPSCGLCELTLPPHILQRFFYSCWAEIWHMQDWHGFSLLPVRCRLGRLNVLQHCHLCFLKEKHFLWTWLPLTWKLWTVLWFKTLRKQKIGSNSFLAKGGPLPCTWSRFLQLGCLAMWRATSFTRHNSLPIPSLVTENNH